MSVQNYEVDRLPMLLGAKDFTRIKRLLDLDTVLKKTPWDVLFILGGGYAIAAGCKVNVPKN